MKLTVQNNLILSALAAAAAIAGTSHFSAQAADAAPAADAAKPKFTIKQVMKEAVKGDFALVKKACKGTASKEELDKMVDYFKSLGDNKPPRGDMESWKKKSGDLLAAAERVQKDPMDKTASEALEHAVECRQCHNAHKPAGK